MRLSVIKKKLKKLDGWDRGLIIIFVLSASITLISLFRGILVDRQVQVEYISGENLKEKEAIWVDIEGAVMKPGVYQLLSGSRIKDVLVMAGGLSEKADRDYCDKNINLAEMIKDGEKVYIPFLKSNTDGGGYVGEYIEAKKINVNTASRAELDTLEGVGEARAEKIIKGRPYKNLEELVSKGGLTKAILDKNRERLSVY